MTGALASLRVFTDTERDDVSPRAAQRGPRAVGAFPVRDRIVRAALLCLGRQGVAKTTVDDIARQAGCSRATVYRTVGAKDDVLRAVVKAETTRLFGELSRTLGAATGPEDALASAMAVTAAVVADHDALAFLLEHEPEVVLPHLAFGALDGLLGVVGGFVAGFLERWMGADDAARAAELAVRVTLSYVGCPAEGVDLADPAQARGLVRRFVLAGFPAGTGGPRRAEPGPGEPGAVRIRGAGGNRVETGRSGPMPEGRTG